MNILAICIITFYYTEFSYVVYCFLWEIYCKKCYIFIFSQAFSKINMSLARALTISEFISSLDFHHTFFNSFSQIHHKFRVY